MAIGSAIERHGEVTVYDEKGNYMFVKMGALYGYTASTLSIREGNLVTIYDDRGTLKFTKAIS